MTVSDVLIFILIFFLGASIGSFAHAWSSRLSEGRKITKGRSYCDACKHLLGFFDLIPIVSFIAHKGKCTYCKANLSWTYLATEIVTGLLFTLIALRVFTGLQLPSFVEENEVLILLIRDSVLVTSLVLVFLHDTRFHLIPDLFVIPPAVIVIALNLILGMPPLNIGVGVGIMLICFGLQYVLSRGAWIGKGDITLGILIGGALGGTSTLVALFASYGIGALTGALLLTTKKRTRKDEIALGSFLSIGTLIALLWGETLGTWYLNLL